MPCVPVYSLLLVCVLPIQSAHETAGAAGTRHSPRPHWGERFAARLGRVASRGANVCLELTVIASSDATRQPIFSPAFWVKGRAPRHSRCVIGAGARNACSIRRDVLPLATANRL